MGNLQRGKIDWKDLVYTSNELEISKYQLRSGDVLFNRTNTIELVGKTSIYNGERPAIFAGYLIRISVDKSKLNSQFLNYVLNAEFSRRYSSKVLSIAVGQANINGQKLRTYPIPLPPTFAEQEAIAAALSDVDALLTALDALIAKKRLIKQGVMQELLTGKRRLPGFTDEWQFHKIEEMFEFLPTANNPRSQLSASGEVAYVHYGDIHTRWRTCLDCDQETLPFVDEDLVGNVPFLQEGDLVIADASEDYEGLGIAVEIKNVHGRKVVAGLHTLALRGDKAVLADGFKGYLQYMPQLKHAIVRAAVGISVYGISKNSMKEIILRLPDNSEQAAIAEILHDMDAEIVALEARREKTRLLRQGMMQELLTGRIRLI